MPSCSCRNKIKTIEERLLFLEGLLVKGNLCLDGDLVISGKIIDPQGNSLISNADAPEPKSGSLSRSTGPVQGSNTCRFTLEYNGSRNKDRFLEILGSVIEDNGNGTFKRSSDTIVTFTLPANFIFYNTFHNPRVSGILNIIPEPNSRKLTITGSAQKVDQTLFNDSECNEVRSLLGTIIDHII